MNNYFPTEYQHFIYLSRYSRWLPEKGRRETWNETVDRYFQFFDEHLKENHNFELDTKTKEELRNAILGLEVMPSMRCLMTAGEALKRDNIAGFNCSYTAIDSPRAFDEILYILMCGTGVGYSVEQKYVEQLPIIAEDFSHSDTTIIVADSKLGWAKALKELIHLLYGGQIPKWDISKLRPAGAPLKTFGGRSSGPAPLVDLFRFCINTFIKAAGRRLTTLECHDIVCKIAEIVVVGGVRRCLPEGALIHTKYGMIPIENISIGDLVLTTNGYKKVSNKFDQGIQKLVRVHTQDSYFDCTPNHKIAVLTGQDVYDWKMAKDLCENDRIVAPSFGIDGKNVSLPNFTYVKPNHSTTCKNITIPKLDSNMAWFLGMIQGDGYVGVKSDLGEISISCDKKYPEIMERIQSQLERFGTNVTKIEYKNYINIKTKSKQLAQYLHSWLKQPKTKLQVPSFIWNATQDIKLSFVAGLMDADGSTKTRPINVCVTVYEKYAREIQLLLSSCGVQSRIKALSTKGLKSNWQKKYLVSIINNRSKEIVSKYTLKRFPSFNIEQYTNTYPKEMLEFNYPNNYPWSKTENKLIPVSIRNIEYIEEQKQTWDIEVEDMHEFFCNGYLMHNSALISLSDISDDRLRTAKSGEWWKDNVQRALANNSFVVKEKLDVGIFMKEWLSLYESKSGERGIFSRTSMNNKIEKLGRREPGHEWGVNPCSEILLRSKQFCNLSEVVIRPTDDMNSLMRKIRLATIIGTIQSTLTNYKYISKKWKENSEEERLLGVSLTGIMDNSLFNDSSELFRFELEKNLTDLKNYSVEVNKEWAEKLGIGVSKAITCVKPSGTISQLVDSASGIHTRHSPYYIRTVRADKKDPLAKLMIDAGFPVENDITKPDSTLVFSFPIKSPEKAVFRKDMSAIEQLELWLTYQKAWCEHNPSVTISVKEEEWPSVGAWVWDNLENVSGVSFLPYSDHVYQQAPYQDCTKEEYEEFLKKMPKNVDWSLLSKYENEDRTTGSQELACTAGGCEL